MTNPKGALDPYPQSSRQTSASARHILDARQFERGWLEHVLFPAAAALQATPVSDLPQTLAGKRLFYLFYEPSTRTRVSFETAVTLLGGMVAGMDRDEHRPEDERLEDRVRVLNQYPYDYLLLRYHEEGGAQRAAGVSRVPVINAGDGSGQHPTQALLDAYTIWREHGRLDGLRIALVGDLSYERSTKSLAYLLGKFQGLTLYLVSPSLLRMREEVRAYLADHGVVSKEVSDLREIAGQTDVVYMTRAQSARFEHAKRFDAGAGWYAVDATVMEHLPRNAIVLHPLPRGPELPPEFDADPRIACFRQVGNGLYVRMALLADLGLAPGGPSHESSV
jgi:aspartate carbamoyltransferase catalytic subunit